MSFLDFLAQLAANPQTVTPPDNTGVPPADDNEIVVNAQRPQAVQKARPMTFPDAPPSPTITNGPAPPDYGNRAEVEAARAAVENDRKPQGHLHRILSNIQDALLVSNGLNPIHKDNRDEQDAQNALVGFTEHPLQAIERLATVNSKSAMDLNTDYNKTQYQNGILRSTDANRQNEIANRNFDNQDKGVTRISQWVYGGLPYSQIVQGAKMYGVSEDQLNSVGITPNMSDDDRKHFAYGAMSVNQQQMAPIRQQQADASTESAAANKERADKYVPYSPPPRQPRAETDLEHYQNINAPTYQKSPADKAWEKKFLHGTKPSLTDLLGGSGAAVPPPPPAPPGSRFRPVK